MSESKATTAPGLPRGVPSGAPLFAIGELVSHKYEIRELLGAGGMGQVYEAFDRELNRRVALKVALPDVDPLFLRREGQALAALHHPSVVTIHTTGSHEGIDYLVLERVYGISLQTLITQRRERSEAFTIQEALDLLISVLEGLVVVHRAGLTHRDIKPGNVMLAPGNRVVLMDFGLMLPQIDAAGHTRVVGSLEYMAPEVLMGSVTPESGPLLDVYAVGVLAYELLAGFVPYSASTPLEQVAAQTRHDAMTVRSLRPAAPEPLSAIIDEMLSVSPADRPQSAETVLWRLRAIRDRDEKTRADDRFTVLIVDDDEEMHATLGAYVRIVIPDAHIESVTSGKQALRYVRKRAPDVLLLDLDLPDVNGLEVCMVLRGMNVADRCMIVAVSGRAGQADVELLDQFGVAFIEKGAELMPKLLLVLDKIRPV